MANKRIVLAARPTGIPKESDFRLVEAEVETMTAGDVLVETLYLSVDPYIRGLLRDTGSYLPPIPIGSVVHSGGVARVLRSNSSAFRHGDIVSGMIGWQQYALMPAKELRKIDPSVAPISTALGVLGMPGLTAYFGLLNICDPKPGETVVVSGAAGAVGSLAGQIAKIKGCRVIGVAGSDEKVRYLTQDLGFDAAFNYKMASDYRAKIKELCPNGIDCYFDNVGGAITDAVFLHLNTFARVSLCGQIAQYNSTEPETGPRLLWHLIVRQAKAQGFLVMQYSDRAKDAAAQMAQWLKEEKLKYRETVIEGIENTPKAFIGLFTGENIGKMLVKVAD